MNLAAVASQLRAAQGAASSAASVTQATAAAASVASALQVGGDRARGVFQNIVGEAQVRAGLLTGATGRGAAQAIPADGTRCEECGVNFSVLRRRVLCGNCDRFLCGACFGSQLPSFASFICSCGSTCPRCRAQWTQQGEFDKIRAEMENGISATVGIPQKAAGFFGSTSTAPRKVASWMSLDGDAGLLQWASLEQRNGRPAEEMSVRVCEILVVRNTGVALELACKGQAQPTTVEFSTGADRDTWARYLELAIQVLTPESEKAALDAERASHRQLEIDARRAANEERKKKLSEGLGMRFTAEAMMSRNSSQP